MSSLITALIVGSLLFGTPLEGKKLRLRALKVSIPPERKSKWWYTSVKRDDNEDLSPGQDNAAYPPNAVDDLAKDGLQRLGEYLSMNDTAVMPRAERCTLESAVSRREWSDLSLEMRKSYTDSILCLMEKPTHFSVEECPGCKSRFDDFSAVHIMRTDTIHGTTNFFTWHRYFLWLYEQALRNDCGYQGYLPYWNWDRYAEDPIHSPLFSGEEGSMGGNGEFEEYGGIDASPGIIIPQAEGGGCVMKGPFKNVTVTLGPSKRFFPLMPNIPANPRPDGLGHNPRCLRRDINPALTAYTTADITAAIITDSADMDDFDLEFNRPLGVHVAGHLAIGGDPGGDFYVGSSDPLFFLHHAEVDRVYWTWQNHGLPRRWEELSSTITSRDQPPSRKGRLDDVLDMGILGPSMTLRDLMSSTGGLDGRMCYIYE